MSRPRITPYERVQVQVQVQVVSVPQFTYHPIFLDQDLSSQPISIDPSKPRPQPVRIQPDPYRDEQGPNFLRRIYYSDGSVRLLHTEHGKTHEVATVLPGPVEAVHFARLYHTDAVLAYLLEGVSEQELAWLQGQPENTPKPQPNSLPKLLHEELDPYRRPSPIDPTPDILKRFCWDDGTTRLYLTDHLMHEVNEVVAVTTPVNPDSVTRFSFVALHLRGISAPYYLHHVPLDEYKWLKESVEART